MCNIKNYNQKNEGMCLCVKTVHLDSTKILKKESCFIIKVYNIGRCLSMIANYNSSVFKVSICYNYDMYAGIKYIL